MSVIAPILMLVTLIAWRVQPHPPPRGTPPFANRRWKPVVVAGVGCGVLAMLSVPAAVLAVMITMVWHHRSGARRQARTRRRIAADFPDALDLLVLSIRAGYLPAPAAVASATLHRCAL